MGSVSHSCFSFCCSLSPRQQTQARALRQEVAALQNEAEKAKGQPRHPQNEEEEPGHVRHQQVHAKEHEGDATAEADQRQEPPVADVAVTPSPPTNASAASSPSQPEVIGDSTRWRRRYEHLAGLLAEQTKRSSEKVSFGVRVGRSLKALSTVLVSSEPTIVFRVYMKKIHFVSDSYSSCSVKLWLCEQGLG